MDSIAGIDWERLEKDHSVTYPCTEKNDPGQPVIFTERFPTASGRGKFVPAKLTNADELPDGEYPYIFITGRQLEHWHTGAMTRRASVLNALEPAPVASIHPDDPEENQGAAGGHGQIVLAPRHDRMLRPRRRRLDPGASVHALLLPRSRRQPADQRGARPVRQNPGIQVLRPENRGGAALKSGRTTAAPVKIGVSCGITNQLGAEKT